MNKLQNMKVDFVRFKATDEVELQGWFTNTDSDAAVIHVHGMSGNGYENYFLDSFRELYLRHNLSFFTFDNRGRGIISDFRQGNAWKHAGSCFEIFDESVHDIQGAIDYLKTLGKTKFILQGHSLGCTKIIHYINSQSPQDVIAAILLAPTDMVSWAKTDPDNEQYLQKARKLLLENKGEELVNAQCWIDKTPISAQTYPTLCEEGSSADIYNQNSLGKIELPMLIPYGIKDIGILKIDGAMEHWLERVNKIKNGNTQISIIDGAEHGFRGYEKELVDAVQLFVAKYI